MLMEDTGRPPGAEYKIGSCIVRIHGAPDRETLKDATAGFLKAVQRNKMQAGKKVMMKEAFNEGTDKHF